MEKLEHKNKTVITTTHHFYCDDCNKHLGSSQEYDDGWYEEFGEFELKFYTPTGWYCLHKHLCDECKEKILSQIADNLIAVGFKKE